VPADALFDPLEPELLKLLLDSPQLRSIRYERPAVAGMLAESRLDRPQAGTSVAHVLNAAWIERRRIEREEPDAAAQEDAVANLAAKATALVREVLGVG
jgi:hypothetical protein